MNLLYRRGLCAKVLGGEWDRLFVVGLYVFRLAPFIVFTFKD